MNCYVVGFIALDEILRFISRGVVHIPFEPHVRNNSLHDYAANSASLRVPFDMITALECLSHLALSMRAIVCSLCGSPIVPDHRKALTEWIPRFLLVMDRQPHGLRMLPGRLQRLLRGINASHAKAHAGELFRKDAAAAANIQRRRAVIVELKYLIEESRC